MIASWAAALVRRWVGLYTRGLPVELRDRRRGEIEADLWDQLAEATLIGRPDRSTGVEILARLVLGVPADLTWRWSQAVGDRSRPKVERRTTMGPRVLGLVAILGGLGLASGVAVFVGMALSSPGVRPWDLVIDDPLMSSFMAIAGQGGIVALSISTTGLVFAFQDRLSNGGALAGSISLLGIFGLFGAYAALLLLPAGSAFVVWDLARARVLSRWLATAHVAAAVAFVVAIGSMFVNAPLRAASPLWLLYPLTWVAIGGSVFRGAPAGPSAAATLPGATPLP